MQLKDFFISMLLPVFILAVGALNVWAELPLKVQIDQHNKLLEDALKNNDCREALAQMAGLQALGVKLPTPMIYQKGKCRYEVGDYADALKDLEIFLSQVDRSGPLYEKALEIYTLAEIKKRKVEQKQKVEDERQKAAAEKKRKENQKRQKLLSRIEFVNIPGGCYQMGCVSQSKECIEEEYPIHEVCLSSFRMSKFEITNAQYRIYDPNHSSKYYMKMSLNGDRQPVVYVSWNDAQAFVKWLNMAEESPGKYRLPTEAEWEYACRARTITIRFWGNDSNDACNYANVADLSAKGEWLSWTAYNCSDGFKVSSPVGSFKPNAFGLYDMLGNVWEWCEDVYKIDAYREHRRNNPVYTGDGSSRVNRGGSWDNNTRSIRSANRYSASPHRRCDNLGIRLVMTK